MQTKLLITTLLLAMAICALAQTDGIHEPSPTKYDYSQVAKSITRGCSTKMEQAEAIYRWLCANISYDTSYTIYTADECFDRKRGVCQAYSELFYRISEPLGLKIHIVTGISNDKTADDPGHSWVFAEVGDNGEGIFIDPTWGAGSVNNGVFTRSVNDMTWFNVRPEWLIFTHFPNNPAYQLLSNPITAQQFARLPELQPFMRLYGFDAGELLRRCLAGDTDLPTAYQPGTDYIRFAAMPQQGTLRVGQKYTFDIRKRKQCQLAIINEDAWHHEWQQQGTANIMEFVPSKAGKVAVGVKADGSTSYSNVLVYNVATPTQADLKRLEAYNPLLMPQVMSLKNFDADILRHYAIDGRQLLQRVKAGQVKSLPLFYTPGGPCRLVDVPLDGHLRTGQTYTFAIQPGYGLEWAVVNEGNWHKDWTVDTQTNMLRTSITPSVKGHLYLAVKVKQGTRYNYVMQYVVD